MSSRGFAVAAVVGALLGASTLVRAQTLGETEVLRSALATHPKTAELRAKLAEAAGKQRAARGPFDPALVAEGKAMQFGYYDYAATAVQVDVPLAVWGIDLFAGYRYTTGEDRARGLESPRPVPIYKGELETLSGGEISAGIKLPLLAGRAVDSRRTKLTIAELERRQAELAIRGVWLELARDASVAYWKWVGAVRAMAVEQALLELAQERAAQIEEQVRSGLLPEIVRVDNQRLLLERRQRLLEAERDALEAAASLSTYYRAPDGQPVLAAPSWVPPAPAEPPIAPDIPAGTRPEVAVLELERSQAEAERQLADNRILPALDVSANVARDFGEGSETLDPTELEIGLRFELPLNQYRARGERAAAAARVAQVDARSRGLRDRLDAMVIAERAAFNAAVAGAALAAERAALAAALAEAERERFRVGASDLLLVNLRELTAAKDAKDAIKAHVEQYQALAELQLALGIDPLRP